MSTALKRMTLEEFVPYADDGRYELVDGQLARRSMSNHSSWVGGRLYALLAAFCRQAKTGQALPDNIAYCCFSDDPERVRKPDVSWVTAERWSPTYFDTKYVQVAPDLIVEVVSPTDRIGYLNKKVRHFFAAGARESWIVDPEDRSVDRRFADGSRRWYGAEEEIDASPLIPGFKWKLADVLANA